MLQWLTSLEELLLHLEALKHPLSRGLICKKFVLVVCSETIPNIEGLGDRNVLNAVEP